MFRPYPRQENSTCPGRGGRHPRAMTQSSVALQSACKYRSRPSSIDSPSPTTLIRFVIKSMTHLRPDRPTLMQTKPNNPPKNNTRSRNSIPYHHVPQSILGKFHPHVAKESTVIAYRTGRQIWGPPQLTFMPTILLSADKRGVR